MRKEILQFLLRRSGRDFFPFLAEYKRREFLPLEENLSWQKEKLEKLIRHAWRFVPYYQNIFREIGLVDDCGVYLERFNQLPTLSKELIRKNFDSLQSSDVVAQERKTFINTSGGSTGEPLSMVQDNDVWMTKMASKWFFSSFIADFPSRQIKLWGSERDILEGRKSFASRLRDFLLQRRFLNSFLMSEDVMGEYVDIFNKFKPDTVEAYVQSIDELARFIIRKKIKIHSPRGIITSAGTLYDDVKENIETAFRTTVHNRYGSREVGDMAFSCGRCHGMHLNIFDHYFEILDEDLSLVAPGGTGRVFVTALNNYSMPLIRYDIGDLATSSDGSLCLCRRGLPLIGGVKGRDVEIFKTKKGELIDGEYFTHLFYFRDWVRKFQIVQTDFNKILIKVILNGSEAPEREKHEIKNAIRIVMGDDCVVEWGFPLDIPPLKNGKYLYTISKV